MDRERVPNDPNLVTERLTANDVDASDPVHARARDLAERWRVAIEQSFETESSLIAFGRRDGQHVVLKVVKAPGDEWKCGEVVHAFGARGMVRVLEFIDGAALFERLVPGTDLVRLTTLGHDERATAILGDVIAAMSPNAPPPWCPTVADWGHGFTRYAATGDSQIAASLVERASEMFRELGRTQAATRLLHGDLHHYNVLDGGERGWVAIDPKGVIGEVEYEIGAILRNPADLPDVFASPRVIERRIGALCSRFQFDADRVLRWAFAQGVLSAIWHVEDGYTVGPDNVALLLARAVEPMLLSSPGGSG